MRSIARMGIVMAALAVTAHVSARSPFTIPGARPSSIREVVRAVRGPLPDEEASERRNLPIYLEGTQCGGWDREKSVGGYIANVWGVPGRRHDWSGDIRSGMGTRIDADGNDDPDDDYEFPDSTEGLTTVCEQGKRTDWKEVWGPVWNWETIDGEIVTEFAPEWKEFAYPFFEDPPCQWRIKVGRFPPEPLNPWETFEYDKDGWETEDAESCTNFCEYLNSFLYHDCLDVQPRDIELFDGFDGDGNVLTRWITINTCNREGERYICTDQEHEEWDRADACRRPHPEVEEWANARKCVGQQCRCPNEEDPESCLWVQKNEDAPKEEYESYYRLYPDTGYSRDALNDRVPQDNADERFQTTCFGFYNEFDPKTHLTEGKDRRCVININVENMSETQLGKGEYREQNVQDRDPTEHENQRPGGENDQPGEYDKDKDTWYKKLGTAFSFVNEKLFEEQYASDLGNVYLAFDELDDGEQRGSPQINDQVLLAESNLMRAFDDTGNPRAYTRWWQEQQTRMAALMRPPVLRIVLPSAWFIGLDPSDPFLTAVAGSDQATAKAGRNDRVELQIEADEDTLGTALAYIERSILLHVEEEPIPIVVPMGSPAEYRARAADWCAWYKEENGVTDCDDAPEEFQELIERLNQYADRIDQYRELRAELSLTAGEILDLQRRLMEPIATWFKEHEQQLRDLVDGREEVERDLLPLWQNAQLSVRTMHERSNLPWCMNHRFTSPIYSLLDEWLPSRAQSSGEFTNEMSMPTLPLVERPEDVIIDFSAISTMTGTIKLPVLKPVQIRIDVPTPPTMRELAPLPSIDDIHDAMENALGQLPEVVNNLEDPDLMEPPAPLSQSTLSEASSALTQIAAVVRGMNERYEKFWKSIGPIRPGEEQFDRQIELKTQMKCFDFDKMPCEHVEMDLLERVQRIGSRPMVHLYEDYQSIGTPRSEVTNCLPEDDACHILNPEREDPGFRWEIKGSAENDAPIDELKTQTMRLSQPPPIGDVDPKLLRPFDNDPSPLQSFPAIPLLP